MIVAEMLVLFLFPALVVYLTRKVPFLGKVGAIALCYVTGFVLSVLPIHYDKNLSQTVASVLVALAIPLVLFSLDVAGVRKLAKKTLIAFALVIVSVMAVSAAAAVIAVGNGLSDGPALAGMTTGLYIGGTPNLFAVGSALSGDINIINLANISDSLVGGVYFLLILTAVKKLYRRLLGGSHAEECAPNSAEDMAQVQQEYDYKSIPRDRKSVWKLCGVVLLAVACLAVGAGLEILINGNMDGSLYIMVSVSVLGIACSFIPPVRRVKGSYQVGQYLILVFSLGLSMSIDFSRMIAGMLPTFLFFACVQTASIALHLILCRLFRIDGGTALITSTAGIYGPPFIAPVANAYGDRSLIVPGVICGTLGLVLGNLLGIGLGGVLTTLL
ncbi:MAG: DUF819 family protein [Clostridiales bacterium]|nr:DUF819 family protein [Candidatus Cacconaster stercorequi]